jgi:hypothetical protein
LGFADRAVLKLFVESIVALYIDQRRLPSAPLVGFRLTREVLTGQWANC